MSSFKGSFTVMVTPFTKDGKGIDVAALKRLVDWQIEQGVPGLIPLGSTGEFLSVADDERTQVVETIVRQARKRVPVSSARPPNGPTSRFATARKRRNWALPA